MGLPRQEHWSGLPCPPPGDIPDPATELKSPALAGGFLLLRHQGRRTVQYLSLKSMILLNPPAYSLYLLKFFVLSESKIQLKTVPHLNLLGQTCSSHSLACPSGVSSYPTDTCCILFITTHFLFSSLSFVTVIYICQIMVVRIYWMLSVHGLFVPHLISFSIKKKKFFFFWPHCTECGILVPQLGTEPRSSTVSQET